MLRNFDKRLRTALQDMANYYLAGKKVGLAAINSPTTFDVALKNLAKELRSISEPDFMEIAPQLVIICDEITSQVKKIDTDPDKKDEALFQLSVARNSLQLDQRIREITKARN